MSAEDVQREIIEPMTRLFLPPRELSRDQELAALAEYLESLGFFGADVLAKTWPILRDTHKGRCWPSIAQIKAIANEILRDLRAARGESPSNRDAQQRQERERLWNSVRIGDLAHQAAQEGWAFPFKEFILDNGREPNGPELTKMRDYALNREHRVAQACSDLAPGLRQACIRGHEACARREIETRGEIDAARTGGGL